MNNIIIFLFISLANVVSFLLIYHSFNKNIEKTKKLLYTMISMGIIYIVVLIIYFFSSIGLSKEATKQAKDMIIFSFVPVNSIILIPFLIRSFNQRKNNDITTEQLNRRTVIMIIIAVILIIGEFFYFRNIEKGIINIVSKKQNVITNNVENNIAENETFSNNTVDDVESSNVVVNEQTNNVLENITRNTVVNNTTRNENFSNIEE